MENMELLEYERVPSEKEVKRERINKRDIAERTVGFFMSGASPYFGIAPFGMSFMTLERKFSVKAIISALFVITGSLLLGDKLMIARYMMTVFIYLASLFVLEKGVLLSDKAAPTVMCGALLLTDLGIGYIRGYTVDGFLNLILEMTGIVIGSYVLSKGKRIIREKRLFSRSLTGEEKLSVIFTGAIIFLSLKNFDFISGFSVANMSAALIILIASRSCGSSVTAAVGICLGLLSGIETDYFLPLMGAFGFCALFTGMVAKRGKLWAIGGLVAANIVVVVYVNGAMRNILNIYEIAVASTVFSSISDKTYDRFGRLFRIKNSESALIRKIKGGIILRLKAISSSFTAFGETLTKLSKEEAENDADIATVFDKSAEKVCRKCKRMDICWGAEFNGTYRRFFKVLEYIDKSGMIREEDMNEVFRAKCSNIPKLTGELNYQFNVYRINNAWRKRLGESREAVSQQISGVSKIINELAREINEDINYDSLTGAELRMRIEGKGVKVRDMNVIRNRDKKTRIEMRIRASDWTNRGKGVIRTTVENIINRQVNLRKIRNEGEDIMIMIDESEQFEIEQGYASIGASDDNGDNFRCIMPGGGKYVITLSDGMGTGKRASMESQAIIELLDSFLQAGFDKHLAVELINSVMILKSANEDFVTLDMCIIDLHTGEVEFIKTGAEPSYIKQGECVETVRASSLPVGLMPEMEVATFARRVEDGDTIVMVTDGVESKKSGDKWIKGFMENTGTVSANELAAQLLNKAIEENDGKTHDDMTVISLKIRKKVA
ncbi:MAG: stage II sporulation protein E [Ruminococcaceae bacterium]|nr:stage II sporulation protein E [Oscillospiraceae bacterium]